MYAPGQRGKLNANKKGAYRVEQDNRHALALAREQNVMTQLQAINERSGRFGLLLSEHAMLELSQTRERALVEHGRVELGGSVLPVLIDGFCDSPFLLQEECADFPVKNWSFRIGIVFFRIMDILCAKWNCCWKRVRATPLKLACRS